MQLFTREKEEVIPRPPFLLQSPWFASPAVPGDPLPPWDAVGGGRLSHS